MPLLAPAAALAALVGFAPGFVFGQAHTAAPRTAAAHGAAGAVPGFETLADGSSRLFVELTKPVAYETKTAKGTVTYVLKGARVSRRNNTNALVTVHFNTPVTSARLVPHGHDSMVRRRAARACAARGHDGCRKGGRRRDAHRTAQGPVPPRGHRADAVVLRSCEPLSRGHARPDAPALTGQPVGRAPGGRDRGLARALGEVR